MKKGKEKTGCFRVFELQKERRCSWEFVLAHGGFERSCERCLFLLLLLRFKKRWKDPPLWSRGVFWGRPWGFSVAAHRQSVPSMLV